MCLRLVQASRYLHFAPKPGSWIEKRVKLHTSVERLLTTSLIQKCLQFHLTAIVLCGICDTQRCSMLSQLSFLSYASVRTFRWTKNNSYFDKFTMSAATAYLFVWEFITEELFALLNNIMIQTLYNSFEISVRVLAMWERGGGGQFWENLWWHFQFMLLDKISYCNGQKWRMNENGKCVVCGVCCQVATTSSNFWQNPVTLMCKVFRSLAQIFSTILCKTRTTTLAS